MKLLPIPVTDLRTHTRFILQRVRFQRETFLVKNFDEPMAVLLNVEEYQALLAHVESAQPSKTPLAQTPEKR